MSSAVSPTVAPATVNSQEARHGLAGVMVVVVALWLHLFWTLVPMWRFGVYYEYGFFMPILVLGLAWRRWGWVQEMAISPWHPSRTLQRTLWVLAGGAFLALIPLRVIETGDLGWRPPLIAHAVLVTVATHVLLALRGGWRISKFFAPVTLLAWSAVPYFYQVEQAFVRQLTGMVIDLTREIFLLQGRPVEILGERLVMGQQVCEVTEGCSGIRSIQSLVMAGLFFGELLWLRWYGRLALVGVALVAAVACNTGRAWYLAFLQFSDGTEAASAAHNGAGHVAFAVAAVLLYLAARWLTPTQKMRRLVRHSIGKPEGNPPPQ